MSEYIEKKKIFIAMAENLSKGEFSEDDAPFFGKFLEDYHVNSKCVGDVLTVEFPDFTIDIRKMSQTFN